MQRNKQIMFTGGLILTDQLLKILTVQYLNEPVTIINNLLQLNYLKNYGVGFSMLNGNRFLILVISFGLIYYVLKMLNDIEMQKYQIPLLMILAGGIGNLIDRIVRGFVVDYVDVNIFNFPVFNFADSILVLGAIAIIIMIVKEERGK